MKVAFGRHLVECRPMKCRFGDLKPGAVFNYRDEIRVKLASFLYRAVTSRDETKLEKVNSTKLRSKDHRFNGVSSIFSEDTIVDYYPEATLYLLG